MTEKTTQTAYFAGGCFWGVEYHFQKLTGVINTQVGYMGGRKKNPSYDDVNKGDTGHAEALSITFDSEKISFEKLAKHFFEIHDSTQKDKQGPDIGKQYRSMIFYTDEKQKEIARDLIKQLKTLGYKVVTKLEKADRFWLAEDYHQQYFSKNNQLPYCHKYTKIF